MSQSAVIHNFDAAAQRYDSAAGLQTLVAEKLVGWATQSGVNPSNILDIGCGTGLLTERLYRQWPKAKITALDTSPAMLREANSKCPHLTTIQANAQKITLPQKFDAVFSSMLLHWLPEPRATLRHWQSLLNPHAKLFVALPVQGSFPEWMAICREHNIENGIWPLPETNFADGIAETNSTEEIPITYPSIRDFLKAIKTTGAYTPRPGYRQTGPAKMRRLIKSQNLWSVHSYRVQLLTARFDP